MHKLFSTTFKIDTIIVISFHFRLHFHKNSSQNKKNEQPISLVFFFFRALKAFVNESCELKGGRRKKFAQAPNESNARALFVCKIMEEKCLFMLTFDIELNNVQL